MAKLSFKQTVQQNLIKSAKAYSYLLNKKIIIKDKRLKKKYILRFFKTNFLHLTGVKTNLSTIDFYEKCINKTIMLDEYDCEIKTKSKIVRLKLKHLKFINNFFKKDIYVQENFSLNKIHCLIATSNGLCTIGFADAKYCLRPKTMLDRNHLSKDKPIYKTTPIVLHT